MEVQQKKGKMKISKTTIAGTVIFLSWITAVLSVYIGKATFDEASKALLAVLSVVGGWGLFQAKDNNATKI
jgi:hypothetical protein